jgi:hypothetical protein
MKEVILVNTNYIKVVGDSVRAREYKLGFRSMFVIYILSFEIFSQFYDGKVQFTLTLKGQSPILGERLFLRWR